MSGFIEYTTEKLPLWVLGLALIVIFSAALEAGVFISRRSRVSDTALASQDRSSQGYIVTAIFALLAFMLATTFSMALSRFDTRRMALATEVDAIGTAYLRASLLDDPYSIRVRRILREYAHCRVSSQDWSRSELEARAARCQKIGSQLWSETRDAVKPVRTSALASYMVSAVNDVLNAAMRREIAGRAVIPARVLMVLLICTIAASAALGSILAGSSQRFRGATTLLLTLYAVCFVLILDIDRSRTGSVAVSQRPMQALAAQLDADVP